MQKETPTMPSVGDVTGMRVSRIKTENDSKIIQDNEHRNAQ